MKKIRILIIGIVCISLVVGLYYYMSNRVPSSAKDEEEITEVQKLILKDLEDKSYPETPRAVIKLYGRFQKCLYNDEYTDKEFEQLAAQTRFLMDQELLNNNPEEIYNITLQTDIKSYKDNSRTINNVSVADSNDVVYKKVNGAECAYVTASYFMKEGQGFKKTYQKYVLRRDEEERWKIVGFKLSEGDMDE